MDAFPGRLHDRFLHEALFILFECSAQFFAYAGMGGERGRWLPSFITDGCYGFPSRLAISTGGRKQGSIGDIP